ncbi:MAG: CvpA family protein [Candidatus Eisenbacteria bacterium]
MALRNTHAMNWLDVTIIVICVVGVVQGLVKGFVRQALSLLGLIFAVIIAFRYHDFFGRYLSTWIDVPVAQTIISFVIILVIVLLLFKLIGLAARSAIEAINIGWIDRIAGGAFGFVKSLLIVAVLFALFVICTDKPTKPVAHSRLAPSVMVVSKIIATFLPTDLRHRYDRNETKIKERLKSGVPAPLEGAAVLRTALDKPST